MEKIYTIPVNEAFDAAITGGAHDCPICRLYAMLEKDETERILGAAMMEPDVRISTNREGFCEKHFDMMLSGKNRLSLALMLESHLDELRRKTDTSADRRISAAEDNSGSCYVCSRIEYSFSRMIDTTVCLWNEEKAFRDKYEGQFCFCLPHAARLLSTGKKRIPKKLFRDFESCTNAVCDRYFDSLRDDIKWFIKKFDYRFEEEPWGNAKDAPERAVDFLCGRSCRDMKNEHR